MNDLPDLTNLSAAELAAMTVVQAWELNLMIRALVLMGVKVDADIVDRAELWLPERPELVLQVREPA